MGDATGTSTRPASSWSSRPPCSTSRPPGCCPRPRSRTRRTWPCWRPATCCSPGCCSTGRSRRSPPCSRERMADGRRRLPARGRRWSRSSPTLLPDLVLGITPEQLPARGQGAGAQARRRRSSLDHMHAPRVSVREQAAVIVDRLRRAPGRDVPRAGRRRRRAPWWSSPGSWRCWSCSGRARSPSTRSAAGRADVRWTGPRQRATIDGEPTSSTSRTRHGRRGRRPTRRGAGRRMTRRRAIGRRRPADARRRRGRRPSRAPDGSTQRRRRGPDERRRHRPGRAARRCARRARGDADGRRRAGRRGRAGAGARAAGRRRSRALLAELAADYDRRRAAGSSCARWPAAGGSTPAPSTRRSSSGSCSTASRPG